MAAALFFFFLFFPPQYAIHYSASLGAVLRTVREKKKTRLFSALAFRLSSRLGLAERESKQFDLSGRVAPSPLRAFQKEKKKDNE